MTVGPYRFRPAVEPLELNDGHDDQLCAQLVHGPRRGRRRQRTGRKTCRRPQEKVGQANYSGTVVYNCFFLRKVARQNDTNVTSLCMQLEKVKHGLLREAFWSGGVLR